MAEKRTTKLKITKGDKGETEIQVLVSHPMETGQRTDAKTKAKVQAHFIQKMTVEHNGKVVADANMGPAVSATPLFGVAVKGAKAGDKVKVSWSDNKGETGAE